jgi:hypothetical protein
MAIDKLVGMNESVSQFNSFFHLIIYRSHATMIVAGIIIIATIEN